MQENSIENSIQDCLSYISRLIVYISRPKKMDLIYFIFSFHFLFYFQFILLFSIFRTTRVRVDQSCCHISHNLMDHET